MERGFVPTYCADGSIEAGEAGFVALDDECLRDCFEGAAMLREKKILRKHRAINAIFNAPRHIAKLDFCVRTLEPSRL